MVILKGVACGAAELRCITLKVFLFFFSSTFIGEEVFERQNKTFEDVKSGCVNHNRIFHKGVFSYFLHITMNL